jgi:hypothetical protein
VTISPNASTLACFDRRGRGERAFNTEDGVEALPAEMFAQLLADGGL